jgi:hypothetical protein
MNHHHLSYITKLKTKRHCQTNILKKNLVGGEKLELNALILPQLEVPNLMFFKKL